MRKWAYLEHPLAYNDRQIFKVMIYETADDGTYVFLYDSCEAQCCIADEWYEKTTDATDKWNQFLGANAWNHIDDPLPDCQHDSILPIRVKGRNIGAPEWGKYEVLVDGKWNEYNA